MKKVLIISYYWPPTGGSGVQRWVKFTKYLREFGWEPVIYTPENPEQLAVDESLLEEIPAGVTVLKRHITEPYAIYHKFFGASDKGAGVNPLNQQKKTFKQRLVVGLRGNLFVPDPRAGWVGPSVRYLRKYLKENPVDAVVTTGPPHSMHLIGMRLKRLTGVRWIADFRDPWTEMHYFKHMGLLPWTAAEHRRMEQKVLESADAVLAVSAPVRDDFQARTATPVHLITNGFDECDFAAFPNPLPRNEFSLVHTGLFASDGNPLRLWDVLSGKCAADRSFKEQLRIRLAGKTDTLAELLVTALLADFYSKGYDSRPVDFVGRCYAILPKVTNTVLRCYLLVLLFWLDGPDPELQSQIDTLMSLWNQSTLTPEDQYVRDLYHALTTPIPSQ